MKISLFHQFAADCIDEALQDFSNGFTVSIFNLHTSESCYDSKLASYKKVISSHFSDPSINRAEAFFDREEDRVILTGYNGRGRLVELPPQRTAEFLLEIARANLDDWIMRSSEYMI